jgi:tubulin--tyrosine ligase-like protein 12
MIDMLCEEFEVHFNEAYGAGRWTEVHNRVKEMVKESFEAISKTMVQGKVPNGTGQYPVATYGLDVLIDANFQPKLLEMTFAPDCERALRHQPSFVQDIFRTLFDGVPTNCVKV